VAIARGHFERCRGSEERRQTAFQKIETVAGFPAGGGFEAWAVKLEAKKLAVDAIVIDHLEAPGVN
jgi:hypothetical protein